GVFFQFLEMGVEPGLVPAVRLREDFVLSGHDGLNDAIKPSSALHYCSGYAIFPLKSVANATHLPVTGPAPRLNRRLSACTGGFGSQPTFLRSSVSLARASL